jgi:hypothetical protein
VTSLEAQQLRYSAGAITALDLERARNSLQLAAGSQQPADRADQQGIESG